ncbi:MAG: septum site-determining protein MinD [Bacillota bacterium]
MSGKAFVITSGKGGVGKTTTVANIGTALAMRGNSTVVVDADIGLRNLDMVMGLENRVVFNLVDVVEKVCRLRQALIRDKKLENLFLLPAAQTREKDAVQPDQMEELCEELRKEFDYILIDSPAGIEQGFRNAIAGADEAIIVTNPELSAVRDADRIIGLLQAAEFSSPRLIVNRLRLDMIKKGDMMNLDDVNDILAIDLLGYIPEDENIIISTNKGDACVLEKNSRAGEAFRRIAARVDGETIPFMDFDSDPGFIAKLRRLIGF